MAQVAQNSGQLTAQTLMNNNASGYVVSDTVTSQSNWLEAFKYGALNKAPRLMRPDQPPEPGPPLDIMRELFEFLQDINLRKAGEEFNMESEWIQFLQDLRENRTRSARRDLDMVEKLDKALERDESQKPARTDEPYIGTPTIPYYPPNPQPPLGPQWTYTTRNSGTSQATQTDDIDLEKFIASLSSCPDK